MIPKIIHYCWFGDNPLSELNVKCIESWRKFLPDYEIKEWNESNFDVNIIPYTKEAYKRKQYAFVSDYARFWILFHYGGLYFDVDVEIIKPLDKIISNGAFMGCEHWIPTKGVATGLGFGAEPHHELFSEILLNYSNIPFISRFGHHTKTVVEYTTEILCKYGLNEKHAIQKIAGITIYPQEYFCPLYEGSKITENTVSIHHFDGSWLDSYGKAKKKLKRIIPTKLLLLYFHFRYGTPLGNSRPTIDNEEIYGK